MGFESLRVELRGGQASVTEAVAAVRQLRGARPDPDALATPGSTFFTVEDGSHVIEIEVADTPVRVSCRFTLCHPPSVDAALLAVVRELMTRLGMNARVCDDVSPEHAQWFPSGRINEFSDIVRRRAATRRGEWAASFGAEQFPAKTHEAFARFILPRSEPVGG